MNVLVSMRLVPSPTYPEERDGISHDWGRLLERLGIQPILVPNGLHEPQRYYDRLDIDGLLLTGGDDLGGPPGSDSLSVRDRTEYALLEEALDRGLPVVGVCRGLQVINAYFGGRVVRALPEPHVAVEHAVRLSDPLGIHGAGAAVRVNSYHEHGVIEEGAAPDLEVVAATDAGVVEALRHRTLPVRAIQWHPERPAPEAGLGIELLEDWLAPCA